MTDPHGPEASAEVAAAAEDRELAARTERGEHRIVTWIRRVLAVVVTAAAAAAGLGGLTVCHDEVAQVGDEAVVRICESPGVTSIGLIALFVLVALLMWPELSEIGLPGGFSLKRKVERQGQELELQAHRQDVLDRNLQLLHISQQTSSTANARSDVDVYVLSGDIQHALDAVPEKTRRLQSITNEEGAQRTAPPSVPKRVPDQRAGSESELLRLWARLERWIRLTELPAVSLRASEGAAAAVSPLAQWRLLFSEELEVVRAARNSVAHARPISNDDLTAALELARTLSGIAQQIAPEEDGP